MKIVRKIIDADVPKVNNLLQDVLGSSQYIELERLGGLTNRTYHVTMENGEQYIVRIPGEGTEEMIDRRDERVSTMLACDLGIDSALLYFGEDGAKVTAYIPHAVTMSAEMLQQEKHMEQMTEIFRKLHTCGKNTGVPFEVFEMAASYEKIIEEKNVMMYDDYDSIKEQIVKIKHIIDTEYEIRKVPCHNDALCANWVEGDGRMYLIDWEYAGMNDPMWDIAEVSLEAEYDEAHDLLFLEKYLKRMPNEKDRKHMIASKIYVDLLWTLWAKTRVPYDGQPMEDWAAERYARLKANILRFA